MYAELLPALCCPACSHSPLTLLGPLEEAGEIVAGALRCSNCGAQTAILDGVWDALGDAPVPSTPTQLTNYVPLTARGYEPAWRWTALSIMSGRHFPLREELTLLRELIQPQPGNVYIDVACSAGLYARALAQPGLIVGAIDHSMPFLREARRLSLARGQRVSYVRASAQALPFRDDVARGVAMGGSLNEIGDQQGALREVHRILQPSGVFFCMNLVAAGSSWGRVLQRLLGAGGIDFPLLDELNQTFTRVGLERRAQWVWRVVAVTLLRRHAS